MDIGEIITNHYRGGALEFPPTDQAFHDETLNIEYYGGAVHEADVLEFEDNPDFETVDGGDGITDDMYDKELLDVYEAETYGGAFVDIEEKTKKEFDLSTLADVIESLMF